MFIDTAKVTIEAGRGGDGAISFRHEIYVPKGGPDGGDGGDGGDVIFRASRNCNTLANFRFQPELKAEPGKKGSGQRSTGKSGTDLIVEVPVGTVVWKLDGDQKSIAADLKADGEQVVVAKGGTGGFGNSHFKSSVRQTPRIAEKGEPGEAFSALLELKSIADVGLVGLPNAGKSTFLSVVSSATPEIADYPFTTLTPSLGVATIDDTDILIADIPGLIEGASTGKGLGHDFLRHIERTSVILHLIDAYSDDAGRDYTTIRTELANYSTDLTARPEIVALTKTESLDPDIIKMQIRSILDANPQAEVYTISAQAHQGIKEVLRAITAKMQNLQTFAVDHPQKARQAVSGTLKTWPDGLPVNRRNKNHNSAIPDVENLCQKLPAELSVCSKEKHSSDRTEVLPVITLKPKPKRPRHDLIDQSYEDDKKLRTRH